MGGNKEDIEQQMAEAILEKPVRFTLGHKQMAIYPKTLGQEMVLRRYVKELGIDIANIRRNMAAEALHLANTRTLEVARLIAVCTTKRPTDLINAEYIDRCAKDIAEMTAKQDLATLLLLCMEEDGKVTRFMEYSKLDVDRDNIRKIAKAKDSGNSFQFGGKTIWGQLIDAACQRYGWTMDYVLWGISYTNLQMLFADQVTTMYMSDEERKKVNLVNVKDVIRVDDPANADRVRQILMNNR